MPANFVKGDILEEASQETGARALAFAADSSGAMDKGFAVAVKSRWPAFAEAFRAHAEGGKMQLGDVFAWREGELVVYAIGIQRGGSRPRIANVERGLRAAVERAASDNIMRILLPRIGGGQTGLDWTRVKRVIFEVASERPLDVVVFEQFIRKGKGGESAHETSS